MKDSLNSRRYSGFLLSRAPEIFPPHQCPPKIRRSDRQVFSIFEKILFWQAIIYIIGPKKMPPDDLISNLH